MFVAKLGITRVLLVLVQNLQSQNAFLIFLAASAKISPVFFCQFRTCLDSAHHSSPCLGSAFSQRFRTSSCCSWWMSEVAKCEFDTCKLILCFIPATSFLKAKLHFIVAVLNPRPHIEGYKMTYFCAVLQLKLVEEGPGISQVWFNLHCPQEPLSGFGDFALTPEQPNRKWQKISINSSKSTTTEFRGKTGVVLSHSKQHVGIMFTLLQSIDAFRLPLWSGLQQHSLCPQNTLENRHRSRMLMSLLQNTDCKTKSQFCVLMMIKTGCSGQNTNHSHLNWDTPAELWPSECWRCSSVQPGTLIWPTPTCFPWPADALTCDCFTILAYINRIPCWI